MSKKRRKRKVKWINVEPKVSKLVRKIAPASYFRGLDAIIAVEGEKLTNFLKILLAGADHNVVTEIVPNSRNKRRIIIIYLDRLKQFLGKEYYEKDKRRISLIGQIIHDLYHNYMLQEGKISPRAYSLNEVYHDKIEDECDEKAQELIYSFEDKTQFPTKGL